MTENIDFGITLVNQISLSEKSWRKLKECGIGMTEKVTDIVKIICEDGDERLAHHSVLKASSDHFKRIPINKSSDRIELEITSEILELVLDFLYGTQNLHVEVSQIIPLYCAAERFKIAGLAVKISSYLPKERCEELIDNDSTFNKLYPRDMRLIDLFFSWKRLTVIYKEKLEQCIRSRMEALGEVRDIARELDPQPATPEEDSDIIPIKSLAAGDPSNPDSTDLCCFYLVPPIEEKPYYEILRLEYEIGKDAESYRKFWHPSPEFKVLGRILHDDFLFELNSKRLSIFKLNPSIETGTGLNEIEEICQSDNEGFKGITSSRHGIYIWTATQIHRIALVNRRIIYKLILEVSEEINQVFGLHPEDGLLPSMAVIYESRQREAFFYTAHGTEYSSLSFDKRVSKKLGTEVPVEIIAVSDTKLVGICLGKILQLFHTFKTSREVLNTYTVKHFWKARTKREMLWISSPGYIHIFRGGVWETRGGFDGLLEFVEVTTSDNKRT